MISVEKLEYWSKEKESQNYKFRTFLKMHADPDELDAQFIELHQELFAVYDCSKCRNCCKKFCGTIPIEDIDGDAESLGMSRSEFMDHFLKSEANSVGYNTKNRPCDFLRNNECILGERKPASCKDYPYTDKEDRMGSLQRYVI